MNMVAKIALGFLALGAVGAAFKPADKPIDPQEQKKLVDQYAAKEFAQRMIKSQLRDPSSAVFGSLNAHSGRKLKGATVTAVCGTVNAKNGFGGYTGMKQFVSVPEKNVVVMDNDNDNSVFVGLWNNLCAGKKP